MAVIKLRALVTSYVWRISLTVPIVGNWVGPETGMDTMVVKGKVSAPAANSALLAHNLVTVVTEFFPVFM
jgi:hypothetical protein